MVSLLATLFLSGSAAFAEPTVVASSMALAAVPVETKPLERSFTLEEAVAIALKNDSRLLSAEQDRIIALERVTEAKLTFLPELGLQASAAKFGALYPFALAPELGNVLAFPKGSQFNPTSSENIYSGKGYMNFSVYEGGRSVNTLRLAQTALQQAQSNYDSVKMDVIMAVKESFFRLLAAQKRLAAASQTAADLQRMAARLSLDPWDRIEVERLGEEFRREAAEASRQAALRRLDFLKALNLEMDTPFRLLGEIDLKPLEVDPQKAALWAFELRPELKSEIYKAQMDAIAVNLAISRRYPTLFIAGDYQVTDQNFPLLNNNWAIGMGVKLPLTYDFFTKLYQKRAEQRQGQIKRAALQDQVRLEVRQACEHLSYWQEEAVQRSQRSRVVSGIYEKASSESSASLAKLKALSTVARFRLAQLEAVTEHALARAHLERAVGREISP